MSLTSCSYNFVFFKGTLSRGNGLFGSPSCGMDVPACATGCEIYVRVKLFLDTVVQCVRRECAYHRYELFFQDLLVER